MSGACEYMPGTKERQSPNLTLQGKKTDIIRLLGMMIITLFVAWLNLVPYPGLSSIIIVITVIIGGYPIFKESLQALRKGRVNMELSMVIAIVASLLIFQLLPAIVITLFALISEFIEEYIVHKGRRNIQMLYDRAPKKALLLSTEKDNGKQQTDISELITTKEVSVDEVQTGDIVLVREGDSIPVDGSVIRGYSMVDQSTITGESIPVEKNIGDFVYAGTINLNNKLETRCEKTSSETAYAKIVRLVEESESTKAPIQKLSDKMATRLIQFAIGLSILTFITTQNWVDTLSVIVVAGACGLAVGTPIALLASNSKFAKNGIIVKGGIQIEEISNAATIVFDKTGTLTLGKPFVTHIISFDKRFDSNKILEYAAIAERDVNHPLAKAIVEKAISEELFVKTADIFNTQDIKMNNENIHKIGRGVSVWYNGSRISVGNMNFIKEQIKDNHDYNIQISKVNDAMNSVFQYSPMTDSNTRQTVNSVILDTAKQKELVDKPTTVIVTVDKEIIGAILLEDKIRNETRGAIEKIKSMGIHPIMLTGDNETVARKIAGQSGIVEYYANLLPEDKVSKIKDIVKMQINKNNKKNKRAVIMVGDGINDAPALAESDIGIAMGKTGTDIVIETADVILMTEDLSKIPYLIKSSKGTLFTIKQNFFGTLFIDGIGFILAFSGALNPLLAAFIHVVSEMIFMVNSARLIRNT